MQPLHFSHKYLAFLSTGFGVMQVQRPYRLYIPRGYDRNEFG